MESLLTAWKEFQKGKKNRADVQVFAINLMDNLLQLHNELLNLNYEHGKYKRFNISDPKPRDIHKANVIDRILHRALYQAFYPYFNRLFIYDSYSSRLNKGTHKALERFKRFGYKVSKNNRKTCYVLKCDIKKFFANIDQKILLKILNKQTADRAVMIIVEKVIRSFHNEDSGGGGVGLPLGNLTSQLFVNIYMNEFDQFVKHKLKAKYYIRYADDFVIMSESRTWLETQIPIIKMFLLDKLKLELHPDKVYIKTLASGVDFLGWVHFFNHRVLRTSTKKRALRKAVENPNQQTIASYLGLLKHGNTYKIKQKLLKDYYLNKHNRV